MRADEVTWAEVCKQMLMALLGRLSLWWHCLSRFHRAEEMTIGKKVCGLYVPLLTVHLVCHDCGKRFYRFPVEVDICTGKDSLDVRYGRE